MRKTYDNNYNYNNDDSCDNAQPFPLCFFDDDDDDDVSIKR